MFGILFAKVFFIVGGMLFLTSITAKINKSFETTKEFIISIVLMFGLLFAVMFTSHIFPLNIILVALFSLVVGWQIGPSIEYFGLRYKKKKYLKSQGYVIGKGHKYTSKENEAFDNADFDKGQYHKDWQNIITQAILGVSIAVVSTASIVFFTDIDFGFLGTILFVSLLLLIVMGFLNMFFFKSPMISLVQAYIGAVIFTFYLLYDFNKLEKLQEQGNESWEAAIDISVNIYLDIINLFLDLLEILSDSSN